MEGAMSQLPSPERFFETVNAYQRTAAMGAALELDLFSAVGAAGASVDDIAARCAASARGVRILCDYLVILDFLRKEGDCYRLAPEAAAFLDRASPLYLGGVVEFLLSPHIAGRFDDLAASARRGGASGEGTLAPEHPVWVQFARAMAPVMALPARLAAALVPVEPARKMTVLDVSASHGIWGIEFARIHPGAEIAALDWPAVLKVVQENADRAGLSARFRQIPGSAFEADFGSGYDVVLLPNFLHHFDPDGCEALLRKSHAALVPGGRVMVVDFVPAPDRVSPPRAAAFALTMLATTPGGDAYTFAEYAGMLARAGFVGAESHPLPPTPQTVVMAYR